MPAVPEPDALVAGPTLAAVTRCRAVVEALALAAAAARALAPSRALAAALRASAVALARAAALARCCALARSCALVLARASALVLASVSALLRAASSARTPTSRGCPGWRPASGSPAASTRGRPWVRSTLAAVSQLGPAPRPVTASGSVVASRSRRVTAWTRTGRRKRSRSMAAAFQPVPGISLARTFRAHGTVGLDR